MKIAVIGATSRTARHLLPEARARGHTVVPFARRPGALSDERDIQAAVQGDGMRVEDLRCAVRGQDAVISIIAAPDLRPTRLVSQATRALIVAMRAEDVRRLIITSSRSLSATRPALGLSLVWAFMRNVYVDGIRRETYVEESDLDWTIVRATWLSDGLGMGRYHADCEPNPTGGRMRLARADYASALLDAAENPSLVKKAVGVNGPDRHSAPRALSPTHKPPQSRRSELCDDGE